MLATLGLVLTSGCSTNAMPDDALSALQQASQFELFSLDPAHEAEIASGTYEGEHYENWAILGSTTVTDQATRAELIEALEDAVADFDGGVTNCFYPRHLIRFTLDGREFNFLICFECHLVGWTIDGETQSGFQLAKTAKPAFDRVLRAANVPLPAERK